MQVKPSAQVVQPVKVLPPHWSHCLATQDGCVVTTGGADVAFVLLAGALVVDVANVVFAVVVVGGSTTGAPGPETDVVMLPLSMYTPEKNMSSLLSEYPPRGSSRTPTCQSAPLELTDALTGLTVCVSGSPPVLCQKPTVLAEKSISYAQL